MDARASKRMKNLHWCELGHDYTHWQIDETSSFESSNCSLVKYCKKCPKTMRVSEFLAEKKRKIEELKPVNKLVEKYKQIDLWWS